MCKTKALFESSLSKETQKLDVANPIPIHKKVALTITEASEYSNIGINRINAILRNPNCPFVLFVGKKKLVKRKEFEEFIGKSLYV